MSTTEQTPSSSVSSEMQAIFAQLVQALKPTSSLRCGNDEELSLPTFNPHVDKAENWIDVVERYAQEAGWSEAILLVRVSSCLRGSAKSWFDEWKPLVQDRTWDNFKRDLVNNFQGTVNFGALAHDAINFKSDGCSSFADYARLKLQKIERLRINFSQTEIVSLICYGISNSNIQMQMNQLNCQNTVDLIRALQFCTIKPHKSGAELVHSRSSTSPRRSTGFFTSKNITYQSTSQGPRCFKCGQLGHMQNSCIATGLKRERSRSPPHASMLSSNKRPRPFCDYCKKPGHTDNNCFKKKDNNRNHKTVRICRSPVRTTENLPDDICSLTIKGHKFKALIDTGAQVSLIKLSAVQILSLKTDLDEIIIKGIGDGTLKSTHSVKTDICLDNLLLAVKFHIIDDYFMQYDVLLGTDILNNSGLLMLRQNGRYVFTMTSPGASSQSSKNLIPSIDSLTIDTDIIETDKTNLLCLLEKFADIITTGNVVPRKVTVGEFKIRLTSDKIVRYQPYRLSASERITVKEITDDLIKNEIIRPSCSPYASPVLLVRKKNGSPRLVCDFRAINKITVRDRYPLPRIDDQIDRLCKSRFFTTLDMAAGFHQIPVHPDSIEKLAFVTPDGQFEYLRMPFGLSNAPAIYQRAINQVLNDLIIKGITLVYMDDVLVPSENIQQGLERLEIVLSRLRQHGFSLNLNKCKFLKTSVEYLGRLISEGNVKPSPSKTEMLLNSPRPTNIREVRQFLGLAGYFRKFIPSFSQKVSPISHLLKTNVPWSWGPEQDEAHAYVISILTNDPVLAIFDPELPIELHTDASSLGYGAIILQIHDGQKRVVAYFSKATTGPESRYHSFELETLAVYNSLKHFRHYLIGINFKLITDCNALKNSQFKRDLIPRVSRWWVYMQDFNFEIEHRPGSVMACVDFLSRNPPIPKQTNVTIARKIITGNDSENDDDLVSENSGEHLMPDGWLAIQQNKDSEVESYKALIEQNKLDKKTYCIRNQLLCHIENIDGEERVQYFVPKASRFALIKEYHDNQYHLGIDKVIASLAQHFWFPGMRSFVKKYINGCLTCLTKKRTPKPSHTRLYSLPKVDHPFHTLHMDHLGPFPKTADGFTHVFVAIDAYSKFCFIYSVRGTSALESAPCIGDIITLVGAPTRIITDNGAFKKLQHDSSMVDWHIEWHFVTPFMHQANGQVERYMRLIANMLRVQSEITQEWANELCRIQLVINSTINKTTQKSPLQLLFGCNGRIPEIQRILNTATHEGMVEKEVPREVWHELVKTRLEENAQAQDFYRNSRAKTAKVYVPGDYVLLQRWQKLTKKLESGWKGPYKVTATLGHDRYELTKVGKESLTNCKTTAAAAQMKLWPKAWCPEDCSDLLEGLETERDQESETKKAG